MKKSIVIIIAIIVLGLLGWLINKDKKPGSSTNTNATSTVSAPVTSSTKISDKLSQYKNEELGFTVDYPSNWEAGSFDFGVSFLIPTGKIPGKPETNTVGKLESKVVVISGKCSFPPVTTIKERKTTTEGSLVFNMISMANSVQGRNYFDRMYSHQRDNICYLFSFSSVTLSPTSKGLKGSEATQMTNNNKTLIDNADLAFQAMVKSFAYYEGKTGIDETKVVPVKD